MFYDQWPFCLVAMSKFKQEICKRQLAPAGKENLVAHQQGKETIFSVFLVWPCKETCMYVGVATCS